MHGQYEEINGKEEKKYTTAFSKRLNLMHALEVPSIKRALLIGSGLTKSR
jgi:hypothetical protein